MRGVDARRGGKMTVAAWTRTRPWRPWPASREEDPSQSATARRPWAPKSEMLTRKELSLCSSVPPRTQIHSPLVFPSHVPAAMDDKIAQFCQVTGCVDPAKAKFFLESSNGEIDAAISAFFGAPRPSVSPEISIPNNGPRPLTLDPMTRPHHQSTAIRIFRPRRTQRRPFPPPRRRTEEARRDPRPPRRPRANPPPGAARRDWTT